MNLHKKYTKIFNEDKSWNYYNTYYENPFSPNYPTKSFIKDYFTSGDKHSIIDWGIDNLDSIRHEHTVSAFFLGHIIKDIYGECLDIKSQEHENYRFSYIWFLTCLFHDIGYIIENDWTYKFKYRILNENFKKIILRLKNKIYSNIPTNRKFSQKKFLYYFDEFSNLEIDYRLSDLGISYIPRWNNPRNSFQLLNGIQHTYKIEFISGVKINKHVYSFNTILDYLEYYKINGKEGRYDHGIVGGLWFYDSAIKNYIQMYYETQMYNQKIIDPRDFISMNHRHFSSEQIIVFEFIADCIISHNIWTPSTSEVNEKYKKCGLSQLTEGNYKKLSMNDNPILYLLAIVDTIEPLKIYKID